MASEDQGAGGDSGDKGQETGGAPRIDGRKHSGTAIRGLIPTVTALLVGALTALAALGGAMVGANATIESQRQQLEAEQRRDVRAERAKVYESYLDAADAYAVASTKRYKLCRSAKTCSPDLAGWQRARYNYQGALNKVYIYGSTRAWGATKGVSAALPPSLGTHSDDPPGQVDADQFSREYGAFLEVMCREVNPDASQSCR